jgi:hypothetical protein
LRTLGARVIIAGSTRRFAMCHDRWLRRRYEEREESRRMWDDFERTQPLSDPEVTEEEHEVTLEEQEAPSLAES